MGSWKRILKQMRKSPRCVGFTYADAAKVLEALGFHQSSYGGSHRRWVMLRADNPPVIIGLVDKGHGDMKPVYVKDMLASLVAHGILSEDDDAVR
ncbi:type II toxin-antitoxin system HicA family toxin [Gemmatimonas sp.]|uniref:type II toxin-antitoxin system HicA family toxin n=1 Tax=Gemmatimonas sp. TaxID=1962908 RepID=UPI0025BEBF4B|nr:type II toxin-antitoxin system HicA family toxin [Gemmatimonas sp.]MCA2992055.1 hypothetical protein [Gemmatimonas sp.]